MTSHLQSAASCSPGPGPSACPAPTTLLRPPTPKLNARPPPPAAAAAAAAEWYSPGAGPCSEKLPPPPPGSRLAQPKLNAGADALWPGGAAAAAPLQGLA